MKQPAAGYLLRHPLQEALPVKATTALRRIGNLFQEHGDAEVGPEAGFKMGTPVLQDATSGGILGRQGVGKKLTPDRLDQG